MILLAALMFHLMTSYAQLSEKTENEPQNTSMKLMSTNDSKISIGGYAEINYNQPFGNDIRSNGELDVQRMVLLFAYQFNDRVDFVTEIEFEHVKEVFVEQAFIRYKLNEWMNLRAGLILIPMGIINEYHEPTTFNGVERPLIANTLIPTTWREIGIGFSGKFNDLGLKYQVYLVNGLNGYDDGTAKISGGGLRSGRKKGAESFMSSPNLSFKIDYYGISNLKLGFSGYLGKTQSTLFDGLDTNNDALVMMADSSRVGLNLFGIDARYNKDGFAFRGAYFAGSLTNTAEYNELTGKDVGSKLFGYYMEASYNLMRLFENKNEELVFFARYENYNTQSAVEAGTVKNDAYAVKQITTGLGYRIANGVVLKADLQFLKNKTQDSYAKQFNAGVAVWF